MIKKSLLFFLIGIQLFYSATAQKSKATITQNLVGHAWKFIAGPNGKKSTDSCEKYTTYKFREDGIVEIRSADSIKCDNWTLKRVWNIIKLHDIRGKAYFGVRITEQLMPERQSYDDFTFEDKIFLIVSIKNGVLTWALKPPYNRPSIKEAVTYLQRK